jgi:hypothetical protein
MSQRSRLLLDLALFGALFVAYNPAWSGLAVHEWLCVVAFPALLFHLVVNWDQTLQVVRRLAERLRTMSKVNLVVDAALFVAAITVMLSGLLVSQHVAGVFGITIIPRTLWVTTHSWSADATMALLLVHAVLHWRWILKAAMRLSRQGVPRPQGAVPAQSARRSCPPPQRRLSPCPSLARGTPARRTTARPQHP